MSKSILVLGLGELGIEVVKSLAVHPQRTSWRIAALLRTNPSQGESSERQALADQLQRWQVQVIIADVVADSPGELAAVFDGFHVVISCNGMTLPPQTQMKIVHAALTAGVKRYFPWQFGIDYDCIGRNSSQDLFDSQLDVRDLLRAQSQMEWVILSTGLFTSFLFEPAFGIVNADRSVVTAIGSWENELTVTCPQDIGMIVAEIVLACPEVAGVVHVSGDTISLSRLVNVVEAATKRKVKRDLKTVEDLKRELRDDPCNDMKKYRVVFGEGIGVAWSQEESFNSKRGLQTQTVDAWAKKHITAC